MEWYWIVLITLLVYWLIGFIVFEATDEDWEVSGWFCGGFWLALGVVISRLVWNLRKHRRK